MKVYNLIGNNSARGVLQDASPEVPYRKTATRLKVLAVDDDPQIRRLLSRILDPNRFAVVCAAGFEEALLLVEQISPNAVLLDLHLSEKRTADGIVCLRTMRKNGCGVPIYILSGDASVEQAVSAAKFGADGYLVKGNTQVFWNRLTALLTNAGVAPNQDRYPHLKSAAIVYLETAGFSDWDLQLLNTYAATKCIREKEIARITGRKEDAIRKHFQLIRDKLGAQSQVDLGTILGGLGNFIEELT